MFVSNLFSSFVGSHFSFCVSLKLYYKIERTSKWHSKSTVGPQPIGPVSNHVSHKFNHKHSLRTCISLFLLHSLPQVGLGCKNVFFFVILCPRFLKKVLFHLGSPCVSEFQSCQAYPWGNNIVIYESIGFAMYYIGNLCVLGKYIWHA